MALNPFGEESNSVHAWREKYRQLEVQKNALTQTLSETKKKYDDIKSEHELLIENYNINQKELSETNQELHTFKELLRDRNNELDKIKKEVNIDEINKIKKENKNLKDKIDDLIGQISRGGARENKEKAKSGPDATRLFNALIPVILKEYDPSNEDYNDSFKNLIEVAIEDGDILTQIIAILFKYGGYGPVERVKEMVSDKKMYSTAVDILVEENIVILVDDNIQIYVKGEDMSDISNWKSLTTEELVNQLKRLVENGKRSDIEVGVDNFRDILTDRGTSATTIFFEIRKLKEGLMKETMTRKEALIKIDEWEKKLVR